MILFVYGLKKFVSLIIHANVVMFIFVYKHNFSLIYFTDYTTLKLVILMKRFNYIYYSVYKL